MGRCVNWGDLVFLSLEWAKRAPEWARPWLRKRLAEHFARDASAFRPSSLPASEADAEEARSWLFLDLLEGAERAAAEKVRAASSKLAERSRAAGEVAVVFRPAGDVGERVSRALDWLRALPEIDPGMTGKLDRVTFAQALEASERWHALLARRAERLGAAGGAPDDVEEVLALPNGLRWVRLLTPEARDFEGEAMGHCVGAGGYDACEILSLRDARNRPHVTIEVDEDGAFEQVKGRANGGVAERYTAAVIALTERLRPPRIRDVGRFGCVLLDGCLVRVEDVPSGRAIEGSFEANGSQKLLRLPDGLVVRANLDVSHTPLTALPPGLRVGISLKAQGCKSITSLPEGMEVGASILLDLSGIRSLPEGLRVHGSLGLNMCENLIDLPRALSVEGSLMLAGCTELRALPDDLRVGVHLIARDCTELRVFPSGVRVGEDIDLSGCTALERLPLGLDLGGSLDLRGCTSLARLPFGLRVPSVFDVSDCAALERFPPDMRIGGSLNAARCPRLSVLPPRLSVGGTLDLADCTGLREIPPGLRVGRALNLEGCTSLRAIPAGMQVGTSISLRRCTALESLPDGLQVKGRLSLVGCTALRVLPGGLHVDGTLNLRGCMGLTGLPEDLVATGGVITPDGSVHLDVREAREWMASGGPSGSTPPASQEDEILCARSLRP